MTSLISKLTDGTISGAAKQDDVNGTQVWQIPCDSDLTISFTFQGTEFVVGSDRLISKQGDVCTGIVQATSDLNATEFVLGGNFISTQYLLSFYANLEFF